MEKCHPLQEGLARPERSASLPLSPHPRRDGAADPSVSPPPPPPAVVLLGFGCGGSRGPGARAGRDGFPPSSGLAPAAPPGLPAHVPPGFLRPRPFGGGAGCVWSMAGTVGDPPGRDPTWLRGSRAKGAKPARGRAAACLRASTITGGAGAKPDPRGPWGRDGRVCAPRSSLPLCPTQGPSSPFAGGLIQPRRDPPRSSAVAPSPSGRNGGTPREMREIFRLCAPRVDKLQLRFVGVFLFGWGFLWFVPPPPSKPRTHEKEG